MKPTRINLFTALRSPTISLASTTLSRKRNIRGLASISSLVLLLAGAQSARAVDFYWDATLTAGTSGSGSGTWTTALPNSWWNGVASSTFTSANTSKAIFGGTDGTYAVTVAGPLTISDLTFNNSGYTLSAATAQAITAGAGTSNTTIATAKSATIGSNITRSRYVTSAAQTNSTDVISGGGTLNVGNSGGGSTNAQFVNAAVGSTGSRIMTITAGTTVSVNSGGSYGASSSAAYTLGNPANTGNPNGSTLGIGVDALGGTLIVKSGGTVTAGSNTHVVVGLGTTSTGTLTIDGGQVNGGAITLTTGGIFPTSTLYGGLRFGSNNSTTGTRIANLNGGMLTVGQIFVSGTTGTSTNTFNFNGGTLQATISNATFMTGLTTAVVKSGGAMIDSNGFDITIGQALLAGTPSGGLTKSSLGTLTLSGASTFTGATAVNGGGLNVTGSLASAVTVANIATLSGSGSTTGTLTLNTGSTVVGAAAGSSFSASTVGSSASVIIAGNNGNATPGPQTMGVVRYSTGAGPILANFSTAGYHAGATLANVGAAGGETQLTYTNEGRTWNSAAGTWDLMTSTTWQEGDFKFGQGDVVTFNDTGVGGGAARAVTLNSLVSPASVTFSNSISTPYTVSGTGTIGGFTGLIKSGDGAVVVSANNNYTGISRVNEGTLSVNTIRDLGAASALGAPINTTNGLIILGSADKTGTLVYTGAEASTNRPIRIGSNSTLPVVTDTGGAVIQNDGSASLSFSATTLNSPLTATSGVGGDRILTLQGSNTGFNIISGIIRNNVVTAPATGTATIGLTKSGVGTWLLAGVNTYTGPTTVTDGTLLINSAATNTSTGAVAITGGTLGGTGTIKGNTSVGAAGSVAPGVTAGTLTFTGALDISGLATGGTGKLVFGLNTLAGTSDKIALTGASSALSIGTNVLGFSDFSFSNLGGLEVGTYKLITNVNAVTGSLDPIPANLTGVIGGFTGTLQFNGDDLELVIAVNTASNYASWANDPLKGNIPGAPASGDFDNDGITNIVEYALGKNPRVSSQPTGILSGNVIAYTKGTDAIANGDVYWVIETSQTLAAGSWTPQVTQAEGDPAATITYTLTPSSPVKNFARLKVIQTP